MINKTSCELKPCPFCGNDASVYRTNNGEYFAGCSAASDTCICGIDRRVSNERDTI